MARVMSDARSAPVAVRSHPTTARLMASNLGRHVSRLSWSGTYVRTWSDPRHGVPPSESGTGGHMKRYSLVVAALIGAVLLLSAPRVMAQGLIEGLRWCPGEFALCAAS